MASPSSNNSHVSLSPTSHNTDTTPDPSSDDDLLFHCWPHFTCDTCLASPYPCSWCAISSACVPNTLFPYPFALFSPLKSESICPLAWRERWELRAKPFSCRCSTMTAMSVVVAVEATLAAVLLLWMVGVLTRWASRRWRGRKEGWWRVRRAELHRSRDAVGAAGEGEHGEGNEERRPLLT